MQPHTHSIRALLTFLSVNFWRKLPHSCSVEDDMAHQQPVEADSIQKEIEDDPIEEVKPNDMALALCLADELWLAITSHLEPLDQLSLRQTCQRLSHFSASINVKTVCAASSSTRKHWLLRLGRDAYEHALQGEADPAPAPQHRIACSACKATHPPTAFTPAARQQPGSHRHCQNAARVLPLHGGHTQLALAELSTLHPTPTKPIRFEKHSHALSTFSTTEIALAPSPQSPTTSTDTLLIRETFHLRAPGIRLYPYHRPDLCAQSLATLSLRLCAHLTTLDTRWPWWDSDLRSAWVCPFEARGCGMRYWFETEDLDYGPEWERPRRVVMKVERRLAWPVVWAGEAAWVGATRWVVGSLF